MKDSQFALQCGHILHGRNYGYEIQKVLGQGSFGITYLAEVRMEGALGSLHSNVNVAVKEFFMKELNGREGSSVTSGSKNGLFSDYLKKFKKEAENLAKLNHPNIVRVLESFEANNTAYYVMEYLSGGNLDQAIGDKGLSINEVIRYTIQIGHAISFMHDHKMLHLDLKPGNVVLDDNRNAILIDFGLSKQYDESGHPESSTSVGAGTPGYSPLEQANYHAGKDFPVTMDIYALGGTMFKMLTGIRPPEASVILNDGFPEQVLMSSCESKELVSCVEKAMTPIKKMRYQDVREMITAVSACEKNYSSNHVKNNSDANEVPVISDGGDWGFYETIEGGTEYGTENIIKHKVSSHIPIPDTITITTEDSKSGNNYSIILHKENNDKGFVSVVDVMGERREMPIMGGIPDDVMNYLKQKGFFSNIHWELESSTARHTTFDIVNIEFLYDSGAKYSRFVSIPDHLVLRRAIEGLLFNTSLSQYISQLTMPTDNNPEDIENKEETIYGGPPVSDEEENKIEDKEDDHGCLFYFLFITGLFIQGLYPVFWCLIFFSSRFSYPNLWHVGISWLLGAIGLFFLIGVTSDNKKGKVEWIGIIIMWLLLLIETSIVYYLNY